MRKAENFFAQGTVPAFLNLDCLHSTHLDRSNPLLVACKIPADKVREHIDFRSLLSLNEKCKGHHEACAKLIKRGDQYSKGGVVMHKTFFHRRIACLSLIIISLLVSAAIRADAKEEVARKTCLWKVSSKQNTVYLLGSIHLLREDAYPLNKAIENAYQDAQSLVLEINLDEASSSEAQSLMLSKGLYPAGHTLGESLSQQTFELVKKKTEELGLDFQQVNRLRPWLVTITLAAMQLEQLGYDPKFGIDKHFFDKAKRDKKETLNLESIDYQVNLLESMSPRNQEAALLESIKELDLFKKDFEEIVIAWSSAEIKKLDELLLESFKEYPELLSQLIVQRNQNWVPKIEEFLRRKENVLVVVGAAHLVGNNGVIELLKQKGFVVEQL